MDIKRTIKLATETQKYLNELEDYIYNSIFSVINEIKTNNPEYEKDSEEFLKYIKEIRSFKTPIKNILKEIENSSQHNKGRLQIYPGGKAYYINPEFLKEFISVLFK